MRARVEQGHATFDGVPHPHLVEPGEEILDKAGLEGRIGHPCEVVAPLPLVEPETELADPDWDVTSRGRPARGAEAATERVVVERPARDVELTVRCGSPRDVAPEPVDPILERAAASTFRRVRRAPPDATVEPQVLHPAAVPDRTARLPVPARSTLIPSARAARATNEAAIQVGFPDG